MRRGRWHIAFAVALASVVMAPGPTATVAAPAGTASTPTAAAVTSALVPVGPIRLADTRRARCGCERPDPHVVRLRVADHPDVPDDAVAAAITVTALRTARPGYVTVHPLGTPRPTASVVNTRPDRVVANATIVPLGDDGAIDLFLSEAGGVVVDLTAVFVAADRSRAGRFVPVSGERIADTRTDRSPAGALRPGDDLVVPLPDGVPDDATALIVNVTNTRETERGFLSVRPTGSTPTDTSILNPDGTGAAIAAATIVPVGPDGFTVRSASGGHVIVDFLGWFTGPSASESAVGLYVPVTPDRLLDTRERRWRLHPGGAIEIPFPFPDAAAVVTNVTVVRPDRLGFVTAHAAGRTRPGTSTVNPTDWNHTVANLAITRAGERGLAYWSFAGTDLIVDTSGWFTGRPVASADAPAPNDPVRDRALLVGDSTLASLEYVTAAQGALIGFDALVDAEECRRLLRPSCLSDSTGRIPNTAVEAIAGAPGEFGIVVVKTGYNDWFSDFPLEFDAVVRAARAKGAHTILWLTYNEDVARPTARRAYEENNVDLRWLTALPRYTDVHLADWLDYSGTRRDWFYDGTHLTPAGTWALADYVSRWIAALEHRPCPRPWSPGWPSPDPCPVPDTVGPVPDPLSLY